MDAIKTNHQPQQSQPMPPQSSLASAGEADELTWPCSFCGAPVVPLTFTVLGKTRVIRRQWCECPAAQADKQQKEDDDRRRELEGLAIQFVIKAGINVGKYAQMTFDRWDPGRHPKAAKHLQDVLDYTNEVKRDGPNLCFLHGAYGTGKTHLAVAALRKITYDHIDDGDGWKPYLVDWADHCSTVQQSWDKDSSNAGPSEGQLWGAMKSADILMIDDLDKGRPTEWAMGKLYEVVQHRYMRERATIITANHSLVRLHEIWNNPGRPEFVRDLGGAILSRFNGQLWGQIEITGPDQRNYEG